MSYYKDTENKLHFIESDDFSFVLPDGCVRITDTEAQELQALTQVVINAAPMIDPVEKLKSFLASNPDVAELLK